MATLITESQSNNPDAMVDLFEMDFTKRISSVGIGAASIFFTGEQGDITWDSQVYEATGITFKTPTIEMNGKIPTVSLIVYGQFTTLLTELFNYANIIEGTEFIHITTHKKFLDGGSEPDTTKALIETYTIDSIRQRNKKRIEFALTIGIGVDRLNQPGLRTISVV